MIANGRYRFYAEVELYITRLVEWTKNSKEATDSLVAELKKAIDVANAKWQAGGVMWNFPQNLELVLRGLLYP